LYAARAARGFGDGFTIIILPAYLTELAFTPFQLGAVATSALLGTAVMTLAVGYFASRYDLVELAAQKGDAVNSVEGAILNQQFSGSSAPGLKRKIRLANVSLM
jgi:MFS family permease